MPSGQEVLPLPKGIPQLWQSQRFLLQLAPLVWSLTYCHCFFMRHMKKKVFAILKAVPSAEDPRSKDGNVIPKEHNMIERKINKVNCRHWISTLVTHNTLKSYIHVLCFLVIWSTEILQKVSKTWTCLSKRQHFLPVLVLSGTAAFKERSKTVVFKKKEVWRCHTGNPPNPRYLINGVFDHDLDCLLVAFFSFKKQTSVLSVCYWTHWPECLTKEIY